MHLQIVYGYVRACRPVQLTDHKTDSGLPPMPPDRNEMNLLAQCSGLPPVPPDCNEMNLLALEPTDAMSSPMHYPVNAGSCAFHPALAWNPCTSSCAAAASFKKRPTKAIWLETSFKKRPTQQRNMASDILKKETPQKQHGMRHP